MANYSYVVANSFNPFTFQEMLTPYNMYKEEYDKQQEAADKLAEKALIWDNMVNQETDPETYEKIKNYTDALKAQAASFAEHGITIGSSGAISDLRRRYSSEMTPIEQGYTAKKAQIAEQLKAKAQDPTLLVSRRADTTSLDDYVKNPMMSYEVLSGQSLTKRVATQAAALANQLNNYGNSGQLDNYTKLWMQQYGFTPSQVLQAINSPGTEESTSVLNAIVDSVVDSSGIKNWGDQEALDTARMYANEGLYQAIGKQHIEKYDDYANRLALQQYYKDQNSGGTSGSQDGNLLIPRALRAQSEIDAYNKKIEKYEEYFTTNSRGRTVLNKDGVNLARKTVSIRHSDGSVSKILTPEAKEFRQFLKEIGADMYLGEGTNYQPGNIGNKYIQYKNKYKEGSYDTMHSTEYVRQLDDSYGTEVNRQVLAASKLQTAEFTGTGWKYKNIDKEELASYKPVSYNYNKYGNTITYENTDTNSDDYGKTITIKEPESLNARVTQATRAALENADIYWQVIDKGYMPKTDNQGNIKLDKNGKVEYSDKKLSDAELMEYDNKLRQSLQNVYTIGAMTISPSSTETVKNKSFEFN